MAGEILFQLKNVSYQYPGGEEALTGIDLSIYRGEKVVLLGANGCGKSTLLKVLDGLQFPGRGSIYAFGEILNEANLAREEFSFAFRRRVSFVFQNSEAQLFNPSVWEEIAFGPVQMGLEPGEVRRRVEGVIAMLGLEHVQDRPPFKLSGGEKKKVAIASVLSINPEMLLLDEPTNGLDPRTRRWLINLLRQLNAAGKTLVTATHDLDMVDEIADRVLVFSEDHRLVATGTPEEVLSDRELLLRVNLVDEQFHRHVHEGGHRHYHAHG
ncbi:energy-coupling factor ABC transporter ATP-binding protein [Desulfotomaculum copahuensis]|uniref:Nickel ABC transporter ATP-binding protein n=1 Tax=Desulfotomaculum copahuensis TaxID=1838280 RepID=A0A1B7LHJ8_9FIRM|nr:ABC transporter ATP-binding protein [Desulfotomaculum copahuensis]OAT85757.1 nickel ABC transporter ATP-binding protein [Desulfotomaculum copahuensis]